MHSHLCSIWRSLSLLLQRKPPVNYEKSVSKHRPIPQVVQRIKTIDHETRLLVVDHETHESLRSLRLTATEEMAVLGTGPPSSSPPLATPTPSPSPSSVPSSPSKNRENGSVSKQQPVVPSSQVQKPTRRSPSKAAKKVSWPSIKAGSRKNSRVKRR